jgi:PAS domain S-box-containing protein
MAFLAAQKAPPVKKMFCKGLWILGINIMAKARSTNDVQKQIAESQARYRAVFEESGAAMIIVEEDMTVSMVNREFEKLIGHPREQIENKMPFAAFVFPEDVERMQGYHRLRRLEQGAAPTEYECRLMRRDGRILNVLAKVGMLPGYKQSIASFMDITSRKRAETALAESEQMLRRENVLLKSEVTGRYRFHSLLGKSPAMQKIYDLILDAASTSASVIIYGESGTGKELAARAIHDLSARKDAPFVVVNCGAIPETLMESELFGYKKGAFTGAHMDTHGTLDLADGGTLFLDEIGEIGLPMQVKLLRAIEGGGYTPLGSREQKNPDLRIISATNQELADHVRKGLMRPDFFYRIHIVPLRMPPLRERREDIVLLAEHFLAQAVTRDDRPALTANMLRTLESYSWPGNVRELQNAMWRYATMGRLEVGGGLGLLSEPDLEEESFAVGDMNLASASDAFERRFLEKALAANQFHKTKVAKALGINRKTLFKKLKKHGIE